MFLLGQQQRLQYIIIQANKMQNNNGQNSLQSIFRSQIVQKYPPEQPSPNHRSSTHSRHHNNFLLQPIFIEQQYLEQNQLARKHSDLMDFQPPHMRQSDIVEEYMDIEPHSKRRSLLNFQNLMASESDNNQVPSRNSSLSSKDNLLDINNRSYEKLPHLIKKHSESMMDIQQSLQKRSSINQFRIPHAPIRIQSDSRDRERTQKITKIQQVGCNCRKSKCLKMYCQCFHLQIFCNQNCNCVDCGNAQPNSNHQQAVIDALARNPKAFQQQKPPIQNGFTLGVQLGEVKKGCKCKKTKCLKKYCQCYNSGTKCGIFCKCQSCQNN